MRYSILDFVRSEADKQHLNLAPGFAPDVDDTAKGILSLNMLGSCIGAEDMISSFEADDHFRTYPRERDPSFSANCNALLALLHQQNASRYSAEILKAVRFLCSYWWSSDNGVKDKWVSSQDSWGLVLLELTGILAESVLSLSMSSFGGGLRRFSRHDSKRSPQG